MRAAAAAGLLAVALSGCVVTPPAQRPRPWGEHGHERLDQVEERVDRLERALRELIQALMQETRS